MTVKASLGDSVPRLGRGGNRCVRAVKRGGSLLLCFRFVVLLQQELRSCDAAIIVFF